MVTFYIFPLIWLLETVQNYQNIWIVFKTKVKVDAAYQEELRHFCVQQNLTVVIIILQQALVKWIELSNKKKESEE